MKVAFINDSCERLGVEYISALLKSYGHQVKIFIDFQLFNDENVSIKKLAGLFDSKREIIDKLKKYNPDIVAVSVVTDFYPWGLEIAQMIKEKIGVPIIFGGIHPSAVPEKLMENEVVDMVCVGEGEYPMLELVESMSRGKIDYSIKNIWFKREGNIIKNDVRPLVENLDSLPFPDKGLFYSQSPHFSICYYIMTSRGCQYACSYCCHSFFKNMYGQKNCYIRRRSINNVICELQHANAAYHPKCVRFFDESLGADNVWLKEFAAVYREKVGIPFICYMHPHDVTADSVSCLKAAGCAEIEIGVQSMTEEINYKVLNRNISSQAIRKAIQIIKEAKISLVADNIFGLPMQKQEDVLHLINYYNENRVERIYAFWLRYYPGVKITQWARAKGILNEKQYEDIINGKSCRPFSRGGDTLTNDFLKLQVLIFMIPFCPKWLIKWLSKKNRYRWLPGFVPPALLTAFSSLISRAVNDRIVHAEFRSRYINGFFRKIMHTLQNFLPAAVSRFKKNQKKIFFKRNKKYEYQRTH